MPLNHTRSVITVLGLASIGPTCCARAHRCGAPMSSDVDAVIPDPPLVSSGHVVSPLKPFTRVRPGRGRCRPLPPTSTWAARGTQDGRPLPLGVTHGIPGRTCFTKKSVDDRADFALEVRIELANPITDFVRDQEPARSSHRNRALACRRVRRRFGARSPRRISFINSLSARTATVSRHPSN